MTATPIDLATLHLDTGSHNDCEDGMCLFEAYSVIRFDNHTDDCPPDVSPVLHSYGMSLNDSWDDAARQKLVRFLPQPDGTDVLAGTRDGQDEARGWLALDWLIRTFTPAWLDVAGLSAEASELRSLRRIADSVAWRSMQADVEGKIRAADRAAYRAAYSAARSAARSAAYSAAYSAARSAARSAAYSAAYIAARSAADSAAYIAARSAADSAAYSAARSAARSAAGSALRPTVETLQASALDLFDQMIDPSAVSS